MTAPSLLAELVAALPRHGSAPEPFPAAPVADDALAAVLGSARIAPSADNAQTWRFVIARDAATRERLAAAVPPAFAAALVAAPVIIAACGLPWLVKGTRREQPFVLLDVPIAVCHMLLQAQELGLACAWTLDADENTVRRALVIPPEVRVIALLALGAHG